MTVSAKTALQLKAAGFQTPEPAPGQIWFGPKGVALWLVLIDKHGPIFSQEGTTDHINEYSYAMVGFVFAPTLDDITPFLPAGFALEIWGGLPSCTNRDDANPIRTTGETFAEAAAKMWLELAAMRGYGAN